MPDFQKYKILEDRLSLAGPPGYTLCALKQGSVPPQKALGPLIVGGEHLLWRPSSTITPVRHEHHPVGRYPGEGHLVGDDHHGDVKISQGPDHL